MPEKQEIFRPSVEKRRVLLVEDEFINESFYLRLVKTYRETPIFKACMMRLRQVISPLPLKRRMR